MSVLCFSTSDSSIRCITSQRPSSQSKLRYEHRIIGLYCIHYLTYYLLTSTSAIPRGTLWRPTTLPLTAYTALARSLRQSTELGHRCWLALLALRLLCLLGSCSEPSPDSSSCILFTPYDPLSLFRYHTLPDWALGTGLYRIQADVAAGLTTSFASCILTLQARHLGIPLDVAFGPWCKQLDRPYPPGLEAHGSRITLTGSWPSSSSSYVFFTCNPSSCYGTPYLLGHICQSTGQWPSAWSFCNSSLDIPPLTD